MVWLLEKYQNKIINHQNAKWDTANRRVVKILSLMINFRVYLNDFFITSPSIFPFFIELYSSTSGSMTLNQTEGKSDIKIQTEYPWGRWGDYSSDTNVW